MKFKYLSLPISDGPPRHRPFLRVVVIGEQRSAAALMLVDSGADETMLPLDLVLALGWKTTGEKAPFSSLDGQVFDGDRGELRFQFGGGRFSFRSRVIAHRSVKLPVFGHLDFFMRYRVTFDAPAELFFVTEHEVRK